MEDPDLGMREPWIQNYLFDVNMMASSLIDFTLKICNIQVLQEFVFPGDIKMIIAKQPVLSRVDSLSWKHNRSGNLSVKSACWLARDSKI